MKNQEKKLTNYHFKNLIASYLIHLGLIYEEPDGSDIKAMLVGLNIPDAIGQIVDAKVTFELNSAEDKLEYFLNRAERKEKLYKQLDSYLEDYLNHIL